MSRFIPLFSARRTPRLALGLLAAGVVLGCGKRPAEPRVAATFTPPVDSPKVVAAGGLPSAPVTSAGPVVEPAVRYDDAEKTFRAGDYKTARAQFDRYVATKPDNPWGHYMLGLSAWKSGELDKAEKAFDRALQLDSTETKFWLGSARVLLDRKREHEALERVEKALTIDSTSSDGLRLLARAKAQLGETEAAIEVYRKALVKDDRDVWAMNNLGVLYLDQGQPEQALGPLSRAVELKPTAPVFRNNLGMALERTGHFGAARDTYQAAVAADSGYARATRNLERLSAMTIDSTEVGDGVVKEQAELFRLLIQMWKDNVR
jgi:predicted Zn-dependent protease